jgi:hypothetical protein
MEYLEGVFRRRRFPPTPRAGARTALGLRFDELLGDDYSFAWRETTESRRAAVGNDLYVDLAYVPGAARTSFRPVLPERVNAWLEVCSRGPRSPRARLVRACVSDIGIDELAARLGEVPILDIRRPEEQDGSFVALRSHAEFGVLPWRHAAISGWILDPDRKKMSKSKGNAVTPLDLLAQYGSDAVRYWAACARLGTDTTFDPAQLRVGRRLAVKLLNVSKLVLAALPVPGGLDVAADPLALVTEPLDRALLARLAALAGGTAAALDGYEHARALELAEEFFWFFCDDYVELVKARAYGSRGDGPAAARRP